MAPDVRNFAILDDDARAHGMWQRLEPSVPARRHGSRAIDLNERSASTATARAIEPGELARSWTEMESFAR